MKRLLEKSSRLGKYYNFWIIYESPANFNYWWKFGSMALIDLKIVLYNIMKRLFNIFKYHKYINLVYDNKAVSQKKFYCSEEDSKNLKIEIKIRSKSNEEFLKINFENYLENFNKEIDLNFVMANFENFRKFEGHIVIFDCKSAFGRGQLVESYLIIGFINTINSNIHIDIMFYDLRSELNFDTIEFILKYFFIEDNNIRILDNWKFYFEEGFSKNVDKIKNRVEFSIIDNNNVEFLEFEGLEDLFEFFDSLETET